MQIYFLTADGQDLRVVQEEGIERPTRIRTDKAGKWLIVIQKDGDEIRNYKIKDVGALFRSLSLRYYSVSPCRKSTLFFFENFLMVIWTGKKLTELKKCSHKQLFRKCL